MFNIQSASCWLQQILVTTIFYCGKNNWLISCLSYFIPGLPSHLYMAEYLKVINNV